MTSIDFGAALRSGMGADPGWVPAVVTSAAADIGAVDVTLYLVDFGQTTLDPLPDLGTHPDVSEPEEVATTMAGKAFLTQRVITVDRPEGLRMWIPVHEGTDRRGVLALTAPSGDDATIAQCEELALLAGHLIATDSRFTDVYNLHRRRREMSLAASMQWDLLPPPVLKTRRVAVAGMLEPAYDVGGDSFDYAVNGPTLDVAIFDAMGHGVGSALLCALAVGSYRHDRREGRLLPTIHGNIDAAVIGNYVGGAFATGQLLRLDIDHGTLSFTNAGHPLPLLVRDGRVVHQLSCRPTAPWGVGTVGTGDVEIGTETLQPGDGVLLFTDGVVDARRAAGRDFGIEALADLVGQSASDQLEPEEIVRRVVRAVLDHHEHRLSDDATVVMVQWLGPTDRT